MNSFLLRIGVCVASLAVCVFMLIQKENQITALRLSIPQLSSEVKLLAEENTRLEFEKQQFERPEHLLKLAQLPEFSHFHYPLAAHVAKVERGVSMAKRSDTRQNSETKSPRLGFIN